ncbi:predicted protein [Pyrenophora tritici-repentis Pt-1C-BFP]|uniref:Uncharacterized protein n=1 Tax=Pyrenophora tritici-repentis (strain Pt-1C-BFP) TaxID=426418 RepID=B2W8N5_PYRTR|nr:uncharacterized protein PTRG_06343 [Pyrenophora tritici-repentis Pt-1C-BFP]EDU49263.1 predicted protein [Pyrenophora tritici-repentis Pt-1C-BFP]
MNSYPTPNYGQNNASIRRSNDPLAHFRGNELTPDILVNTVAGLFTTTSESLRASNNKEALDSIHSACDWGTGVRRRLPRDRSHVV